MPANSVGNPPSLGLTHYPLLVTSEKIYILPTLSQSLQPPPTLPARLSLLLPIGPAWVRPSVRPSVNNKHSQAYSGLGCHKKSYRETLFSINAV